MATKSLYLPGTDSRQPVLQEAAGDRFRAGGRLFPGKDALEEDGAGGGFSDGEYKGMVGIEIDPLGLFTRTGLRCSIHFYNSDGGGFRTPLGHGNTRLLDHFPYPIIIFCLFNLYKECIMQNARLDETQAGIKIAGRNINNLRFADDTWHPIPVLLPGKSHGWRSLVGCSPWGR